VGTDSDSTKREFWNAECFVCISVSTCDATKAEELALAQFKWIENAIRCFLYGKMYNAGITNCKAKWIERVIVAIKGSETAGLSSSLRGPLFPFKIEEIVHTKEFVRMISLLGDPNSQLTEVQKRIRHAIYLCGLSTQTVDLSDMAYLVIVIDEVADLMGVARKEVEACVQRLAQKARAAGIHLVMATQRPDATTITGVIKANFPTRISFQARSNIDSMTTLGEKGAENLLACGDMLFSEAGRVPVRIHGAFIEPAEMTRVADFWRAQGAPEYVEGVIDGETAGGAGAPIPGMPGATGDKDADLYAQAKECVLRDKKPTISYIQRRLQVGYNKAAGFMERMEQEGIVSAPDPNGKRHIL
jgi:DNA segregation ATPase FtsK/SpoIIIE-like protein